MKNENLKRRTKTFALDVVKLVESLPHNRTCDVLGRQLLRAGTSVGANYRAACRAKSPADFVSKPGNVEEEADESGFWVELLIESGHLPNRQGESVLREANELCAIMVASINTTRKNQAPERNPHSALRTPHSALR